MTTNNANNIKKQLATTINKLRKAGKRMPQDLRPGLDPVAEATRVLIETVDLWYDVFGGSAWPGDERWASATTIALTMTKADGLNVNMITPALMRSALAQAEANHVAENINRDAERKQQAPLSSDEHNASLVAARWTAARFGVPGIFACRPNPDDVQAAALNYHVSPEYRVLIRCWLMDQNYAKTHPDFRASNFSVNRDGSVTLTW